MSSEGMYKEGGQKEEKKKGEEFKSKELMGELQKKQAYKAHARSLSNKDVFSLFSGFKKKWVKGLLGTLKRLLG